MLNWPEDLVRYINRSRSKRLYDTLVKWAISNPLECITYVVEYGLYNVFDKGINRLKFGYFKFEYKNTMYNIVFETKNIVDIQTFLGSDLQQTGEIKLKERQYYTIYFEYYANIYSLYSDNHLTTHDDLIDWFVNIAKIMKDKESKALFL